MKLKTFMVATAAAVIVVILTMTSSVLACSIELVSPEQLPPQVLVLEPIQTKDHTVNVNIKDQVAEITVQATFYNPNSIDLEGDYWFPLYTDAAVTSFSMMVNGKEMQAELLDAGRARQIYEEIVRRYKDPALLEFAELRMLRQRIYPISAKGEVKIFLKYSQLLKNDSGTYQLKYPLSSAMPENGTIGNVSINIFIDSKTPLKNIYSSSHNIKTDKTSENAARVKFSASSYNPDKPFVLYYTVSD
jgi:Ca-activated chloride channel family protein